LYRLVKALSALLWLPLFAAAAFAADEPEAPPSLPIIYEQPGDRYILRLDNRRYQMPVTTKAPVSQLMVTANYRQTKLLYDEFKRSLDDKAKSDMTIRQAERGVEREEERVARQLQVIENLESQLAVLRGQQNVTARDLLVLNDQIRQAKSVLANAKGLEAKARAGLERTRAAAEATFARTDKARDTYVKALAAYEKTLAEIRALALSLGTSL
jgi:chromosome segregation ATPase